MWKRGESVVANKFWMKGQGIFYYFNIILPRQFFYPARMIIFKKIKFKQPIFMKSVKPVQTGFPKN
jgi:hypothetical protein